MAAWSVSVPAATTGICLRTARNSAMEGGAFYLYKTYRTPIMEASQCRRCYPGIYPGRPLMTAGLNKDKTRTYRTLCYLHEGLVVFSCSSLFVCFWINSSDIVHACSIRYGRTVVRFPPMFALMCRASTPAPCPGAGSIPPKRHTGHKSHPCQAMSPAFYRAPASLTLTLLELQSRFAVLGTIHSKSR